VLFDSPRESLPQSTLPPTIRPDNPAHYPREIYRWSAFSPPILCQTEEGCFFVGNAKASDDSNRRGNPIELNVLGNLSGMANVLASVTVLRAVSAILHFILFGIHPIVSSFTLE
jgi:hypothetical protein